MSTDLQRILTDLTNAANHAADKAGSLRDRIKSLEESAASWEAERDRCFTAIDTLRSHYSGTTYDRKEEASEGEATFHGEPAFATASSASANGTLSEGLDRVFLRRELASRRIYYPAAKSYKNFWQFLRQSTIAKAYEHPDYQPYVDGGGINLSNNQTRTQNDVNTVAKVLNLDIAQIEAEARVIHNMLFKKGVAGRDYKTS